MIDPNAQSVDPSSRARLDRSNHPVSGAVRGYFQYRDNDGDEREFVESPDGHYVVTAELKARWERTLSAMAQMQAEIEVLCTEQGPEPQRPMRDSAFIPAAWAASLTQAMTTQLLLKPEES